MKIKVAGLNWLKLASTWAMEAGRGVGGGVGGGGGQA